MLQKGIEVNLPVSARANKIPEERLYVTVPATFRTDRRVQIGDETIGVTALAERMRQSMEGRDQKEIFLRGDGSVQLQDLTEVFDLLKAGGVERVGILTTTPPRR
jgi:biopolymer transport protein ExbD